MATVKGQNLRVFVGNKVVAASTNLTLHVAMQTESISTKDTDSDWEEVLPVGLNWDVQVDALVTNGTFEFAEGIKCTTTLTGVSGFSYYYNMPINLKNGDTLSVSKVINTTKLGILDSSLGILVNGATTDLIINYTATADCTVYVACSSSSTVISYQSVDSANDADDLLDILEGKTPVTLEFEQTSGVRNRTGGTTILTGDAYVTDFSATAPNRANSTYSVTFTGNGDLTQPA